MLLEHELLDLARIWRHREKIEHEAASQFKHLERSLRSIEAPDKLIQMAATASEDEERHASLCRGIVERLSNGTLPAPQPPAVQLPAPDNVEELSKPQLSLYASLAISCVTETLSTALLLEMRELAGDESIRNTIQSILKDEVQHSRIGWAHLAWEADRSDVSWLSKYIAGMIGAALATDESTQRDLPANSFEFGVLVRDRSRAIVVETFEEIVFPGLERYRIHTDKARGLVQAYG